MLGRRGTPNQRCPLKPWVITSLETLLLDGTKLKDFKMTGREFLELDSPQQRLSLERFKRMEVIQKIFNELPKADQNLCNHGSYFLAANSSLCGLAANNFFRNILHIRRASLVSALPMAVIPFLSTAAVYEVFVREPLFAGELNCEVCAVVRGGLIGAVVGGLYPVFLALPMNASLAARYSSSPLPGKENLLRFWFMTAQPIFRKMSLGVLIQVLTGLYLATKHHGIYVKILQRMHASRDPEELQA
ncbi:transmembrane protein 126A-like [Grus japonensis]|uniref:Transmembrane protein 126A-like n=1 Tax=Grus japonensis TaxID=30415 RepID=A0ABC9W9L4_GRUJA